jgi:fructosamine-3-kinase
MVTESTWAGVAAGIARATGAMFEPARHETVAGGCINATAVLTGADGRRYFVKLNDAMREEMFRAETEGLAELARAAAVRVPQPICVGTTDRQAFFVLEFLALGPATNRAAERLGEGLARQHRVTRAQFGWHRNNTIGATPQINTPHDDWVEFYRRERLGYQLALAAQHGHGGQLEALGEQLLGRLPAFFSAYRPVASLLHGDLWSGNHAATSDDEPVIFDPAVYYGDREADLAMTELFGGFSESFYRAYRAAWPLDPGYTVRRHLYNLYHVLNHLNLFGGGYAGQAERMMRALLAEVR